MDSRGTDLEMKIKEELDSILNQRRLLDQAISKALVELSTLMQRRGELDDRVATVMLKLEPQVVVPRSAGPLDPLQSAIMSKLQRAIEKDQSGTFTNELEKVLNL